MVVSEYRGEIVIDEASPHTNSGGLSIASIISSLATLATSLASLKVINDINNYIKLRKSLQARGLEKTPLMKEAGGLAIAILSLIISGSGFYYALQGENVTAALLTIGSMVLAFISASVTSGALSASGKQISKLPEVKVRKRLTLLSNIVWVVELASFLVALASFIWLIVEPYV